jgi:enediyne biosynthesis protein E3
MRCNALSNALQQISLLSMSVLIQKLLFIDPREAEFARRGFTCALPAIQARLENVGRVFLHGYSAALAHKSQNRMAKVLNQVEPEDRGFAYEGAAMALTLLDALWLRRNAFLQFADGAGKWHIFMLHVGAGWAYARVPWLRRRIEEAFKKLDPILRWLVIDGYGFHQGYFHSGAQIEAKSFLRLSPEARHVFYQGLGRSLWFVHGADAHRIANTISTFPQQYHSDAWSGVGLACAYAGGISPDAITAVRRMAGIHTAALAQGAAFAAKARELAGNPARHTELTCAKLCGISAAEAAALCDQTLSYLAGRNSFSYQAWRELVQKSLSSSSQITWHDDFHGFLEPASSKVH